MPQPKDFATTVRESNSKKLMAYVTNLDEVPVGVATLDTITYRAWQYESEYNAQNDVDGEEIGEETELEVAEVIFDDLQTGGGWPANQSTGFNFSAVIPGARFPEGGTWVRIEFTFTPSPTLGEEPFDLVVILKVLHKAGHT